MTIEADLLFSTSSPTVPELFSVSEDWKDRMAHVTPAVRLPAAVSARAVTVLGQVNGQISADVVDIGRPARVQANVLAKHLSLASPLHKPS